MYKTIEFEKSLKKLEKIVQELEKGNLTIAEALKKYEQGLEFAKGCSKMLKEVKTRVEKLNKRDSALTTEKFEPEEEEDVS